MPSASMVSSKVFDFEGQMHEVFLHFHRATGRETAEFDQFLAVGHFEKGQMRSARRDFPFQDLQAQHVV